MTTPTTTKIIRGRNITDPDLRIDVNTTLANIFGTGSHEETIEQLCAISDWAYNTRLDLMMANSWLKVEHITFNEVCNDLARHVNLTAEQLQQFIEWERF